MPEKISLENATVDQLKALKAKLEKQIVPTTIENASLEDLKRLRDTLESTTTYGQIKTGLKDTGIAALKVAGAVGEMVDRFTGAPTRAAVGAVQSGKGITGGLSAFAGQFGRDPSLAPTGKDIAVKAGISPQETIEVYDGYKVSPAGIAGFAADVILDPTNVLSGVGVISKGLTLGAKGLTTGTKLVLKGSAAAIDAATGVTDLKRVIDTAIEAGKEAGQILVTKFKPSKAPDYDELVAIATKNNIDPDILPEAIKYGQESVITRAVRQKGSGVLGEPVLRKHENAIKQVNRALNNKIEEFSGGRILDELEAGNLIRTGYDNALKRVFSQMDVTYDTVADLMNPLLKKGEKLNVNEVNPRIMRSFDKQLDGIAIEATKKIRYGVLSSEKVQGQQLLDVIQIIKSSNGDYRTLLDQMRSVGHAAFESKSFMTDVPPDIKNMRDIYFGLQDIMIDTTGRILGKAEAETLKANNKIMKEFFTDKNILSKAIGKKELAGEKIFSRLVTNGDSKTIDALKGMLAPDEFKQLKGAFMESVIKRNIQDKAFFNTLFNTLDKKDIIVKGLFDPQEINDLQEILKLGTRMGIPILSTSETGAALSFKSFAAGIPEAISNDVVIDSLKRAADGQSLFTKPNIPTSTSLLQKRTPFGKVLKGTQVFSVQQQNEDTPISRLLRGR